MLVSQYTLHEQFYIFKKYGSYVILSALHYYTGSIFFILIIFKCRYERIYL